MGVLQGRGGGGAGDYAFSIDLASNIAGSVVAFANVDTANPIDAHSGQKNGLVATFDTPPITTTAAGGVAVWFGSQVWAGTTCPTSPIVPPSGFTEVLDTCLPSAGTALLYDAAYKVLGAAGPSPRSTAARRTRTPTSPRSSRCGRRARPRAPSATASRAVTRPSGRSGRRRSSSRRGWRPAGSRRGDLCA
ncbi:hypothetical protein [Nannocystis pusilla]|uniref:hypothetical protein n=1 Tax=Nannocystis pusilla TaxID=889268 RepID=UPI003B79A546